MKPILFSGCILVAAVATAGEWSQWRGSQRNGVVADGVPLLDAWPEGGPKLLWRSETIPSGDDGGHGSVVAPGVGHGAAQLLRCGRSGLPSVLFQRWQQR